MLSLKTCLINIANWIKGVDDYIIERGVSGIWNYEKYKSGIVKCYGVTDPLSSGALTKSQSIYYSHVLNVATIPTWLSTPSYINATMTNADSVGWVSKVDYFDSDRGIHCVVEREQPSSFHFQMFISLIGTWGATN